MTIQDEGSREAIQATNLIGLTPTLDVTLEAQGSGQMNPL